MLISTMNHFTTLLPIMFLAACSGSNSASNVAPEDFLAALSPLCDQTFMGKVTSDDPQDEDWRAVDLTLGPIVCAESGVVSMPLAVGEDTSRKWFLTSVKSETGERIEFRHQHLLKDGSVDPVSDYGGYSQDLTFESGAWSVEFPADEKTVAIFKATGLDVSITNVWSFDYRPDVQLTYELNRENRHFRAEFDLAKIDHSGPE